MSPSAGQIRGFHNGSVFFLEFKVSFNKTAVLINAPALSWPAVYII